MALSKVSTNQIDTAATPTVAEATVTGDLTVDTNTLHVDAANNNVGIGTTSIEDFGGGHVTLEVAGSTTTQGGVFKTATLNSAGSGSTGEEMIMYTSSSGGTINVVTSDPLRFLTANTERGRFLAGGGLTFNGDTAAANALNDYEEGTWTPSVDVGTVSGTSARYVKVGQIVTIMAYIHSVSNRTAGDHFKVGGIPYDIHASAAGGGGVMGRYVNNGGDAIVLYAGPNSDKLALYTTLKGGDYAGIGHNDLNSAAFNLYINFTYITDA